MEEKKKQFRVYVDYSRRVYSKPIEVNSLKEAMDRFYEQRYHMYDDLAYDEEADWDSEEICCDLGAKEYCWLEEDKIALLLPLTDSDKKIDEREA